MPSKEASTQADRQTEGVPLEVERWFILELFLVTLKTTFTHIANKLK